MPSNAQSKLGKHSKHRSETRKLEGEGSYEATRSYNKHLKQGLAKGDIESGAEAARRALEGPEAEELRRAEAQGKRGPAKSGK